MARMYQQVMDELLDAVVTGRYAAASWLPSIEELAASHGRSLATVRDAIRALEERGLLAVVHGRGLQVLADDRWALLDRDVATALLVTHPSRSTLAEAAEALRLVEVQAAILAAERACPGDAGMLDAALERMRAAGTNGRAYVEAESDFHRAVALISGNRFLASMLETLPTLLAAARRERAPDRNALAIMLLERVAVAIRHEDPQAAAAAAEDYGTRLASWLRSSRP